MIKNITPHPPHSLTSHDRFLNETSVVFAVVFYRNNTRAYNVFLASRPCKSTLTLEQAVKGSAECLFLHCITSPSVSGIE
jgi:hypothetical protein